MTTNLGEIHEPDEPVTFEFRPETMKAVLEPLASKAYPSIRAYLTALEDVISNGHVRNCYAYEAINRGYILKTKQPKGRAFEVSLSSTGMDLIK